MTRGPESRGRRCALYPNGRRCALYANGRRAPRARARHAWRAGYLSQVVERLGQSSKTAYARYEQGDVMPSIDKIDELLCAVAPDAAIVINKRLPTKSAGSQRRGEARRKGHA